MSAASRGRHALSSFIRGPPSRICTQCARGPSQLPQFRHPYSSAAAAVEVATPPPPEPPLDTPPPPVHHPKSVWKIKSGIILTRPPLLTRAQKPFESAFYLYQKRLNERLCAPFVPVTYFKKDTATALDWEIKYAERSKIAGKDVGRFHGRSPKAVDDEVPPGDTLADPEYVRAVLLEDAEMRVSDDGEKIPEAERVPVEQPMPRRTEADQKGDTRRLDRELEKTLYLVVQGKDGSWSFPTSDVLTSEALHETAARVLESSAGVNMNTWIVGRVPVAHHVAQPVPNEDSKLEKKGEKIFFLKARIMAGQADLTDNKLGLTDFKWLTKEELKKELPREYFHSVRGMMGER